MNPLFYFFLALTAVLAATANAAGPVLDSDGDIITPDGSYYVVPPIFGHGGGGVSLARSGNNKPCPLNIVQAKFEFDDGIPVIFSNWKSKVGFVPQSEDLNIQSDFSHTMCGQKTYWWVDQFDPMSRKWFLVTGAKPEGFGENSEKSFFQIQKPEHLISSTIYKIAFCPVRLECNDVGIFQDENGVRRLALSNEPFLVMFKKADEDSSKTM